MPTKNQPERIRRSAPLSGALASDNGGSFARKERERFPNGQNGGTAPAPATRVDGANGHREGVVSSEPKRYDRARLEGGWATAHAGPLAAAKQLAQEAAARSGKPWTLEADRQTRAILEDFPVRQLKPETLAKYRADYDRLRACGVSPLEAASTPAHWQRLRTASRYCLAEDVRRWRAASERARKADDLPAAQRLTEEAHRLAMALDGWHRQPDTRLSWAAKAKALAAQGKRPTSKSRRRDTPPPPDLAISALLFPAAKGGPLVRGDGLALRHADRLAVLALTGLRPAELMAGVRVRAVALPDGQPMLEVEIKGAKVDGQRGHHVRTLTLEAKGPAAAALRATAAACGGAYTLATTAADYRSLNRALQRHGLSCYSFRHALGSELKAWVCAPATATYLKPGEAARLAAQAMGHRSTASLAYYGTRAAGRSGGRPPLWSVGATEADLIKQKNPAFRSRGLPMVRFPQRVSAAPSPVPNHKPAPGARAFPKPRPSGA